MQEASWAAAGMLAACDPENPAALLPLAAHSQELYDAFLQRIEALSGLPVPYRTQETLQQFPASRTLPSCPRGRWLSAAEAERHLPGLASGGHPFLLLPERSLDPRDLCLAMPLAAQAAGIEVRAHAAVRSVSPLREGVQVEAEHGRVRAGAYLNCMGAWASGPEPAPHHGVPYQEGPVGGAAIAPRKGQIAVVRLPQGSDLTSVIRSKEVYLVPRGDGRVVVGATVETAGFDKQVVPEALAALLARAAVLWPSIREASLMDQWAGLRPGTADDLPLIGSSIGSSMVGSSTIASSTIGSSTIGSSRIGISTIGDSSNSGAGKAAKDSVPGDTESGARCFIAAGHFRNGILLAPATADVVASLIEGTQPRVALAAFAPHRGDRPQSCDKLFTAAL